MVFRRSRITGFWKRAQIIPADLALAGVASFADLDRLTIFADNLVPHVLRVDGVLVYEPDLVDPDRCRESSCPRDARSSEIRACAVHACGQIAERFRVSEPDARQLALEPRAGAATTRRSRATAPGRPPIS